MSQLVPPLRWLQRGFRKSRMADFVNSLGVDRETKILDVGGTPHIWSYLPEQHRVVLLNIPGAVSTANLPRALAVAGDGCQLPFADQSFDIVFSNSVIEHLGSREAQKQFAAEVSRVGRGYWIQTPNLYFPIEAHLLTPLIHWIPKRWSAAIVRRFSFWELLHRPTAEQKSWYVEDYLQKVRLLSSREMGALFPDGSIRSEYFLFKKSIIAWRKG